MRRFYPIFVFYICMIYLTDTDINLVPIINPNIGDQITYVNQTTKESLTGMVWLNDDNNYGVEYPYGLTTKGDFDYYIFKNDDPSTILQSGIASTIYVSRDVTTYDSKTNIKTYNG